MSHHKKESHHVRPFKMVAQSFGMLVCGFFLLFLIGDGLPDLLKGNDLLILLPMILLPFAGYLLTWFNEWLGAMLLIAGGIILLTYFMVQQDVKLSLIVGIPFIVAGSLFILHIKKRTALQHRKL